MKKKLLKNIFQLIDAIGAGCSPSDRGPVVLEYQLWDGRIVTASYNKGNKKPDAVFPEEVVFDHAGLLTLAEGLLNGRSFVIDTSSGDTFCSLEWTISTA
ncbi:MAG: hypothetical protein U0944_01520 [Candidatus Moranbacteria bacterium]|nr:hypothetical protein [bacterium]MDP1833324.1 hypothetical protein [Candidatus Moranbacteria bacterium]MDZ4385075.1 hypothetical protein [Candidatus Moranbacteria bacterium]